MKIAKLDKRLELLRPVVEDDRYGGMSTDYVSEGFVWAQVMRTDYAAQEAQGTPMSRAQLRFKLRPRFDIQRGWLLVYQGERYVVDVVDQTYRDNTVLIVKRYEQGV